MRYRRSIAVVLTALTELAAARHATSQATSAAVPQTPSDVAGLHASSTSSAVCSRRKDE
jgi:hypothetical protein